MNDEAIAIPAEGHGYIGRVERLVGTLKRELLSHLRSSEASPEVAVWSMVSAHNQMTNIAGFSQEDWVFRRRFSDADRFHDSPNVPYWPGLASNARMQHKLLCKLKAAKNHREIEVREKMNAALNTQRARSARHEPGDVVFQKRFQPPADRAERFHALLEAQRRKVARWYGPARVVVLETKMTYHGHVRQPSNIAWIIASGRLKMVAGNQVHHCSEPERFVAPRKSHYTIAIDFSGSLWLEFQG